MNEKVDRLSFGVSLSVATLALQQDHVINQGKEDRFLILGLKQSGRPAFGHVAQKAAGRMIMNSLLSIVFQGPDHPSIRDIFIVGGPVPPPWF